MSVYQFSIPGDDGEDEGDTSFRQVLDMMLTPFRPWVSPIAFRRKQSDQMCSIAYATSRYGFSFSLSPRFCSAAEKKELAFVIQNLLAPFDFTARLINGLRYINE